MTAPKPETIDYYHRWLQSGLTPRQAQHAVFHTYGQAEAFRIAEWARRRLIEAWPPEDPI